MTNYTYDVPDNKIFYQTLLSYLKKDDLRLVNLLNGGS